jgi:hypothetical protein
MPKKPKTTKPKPTKRFINLPVWPSVNDEVKRIKELASERGDFVPGTSPLLIKALEAYKEKFGLQAA